MNFIKNADFSDCSLHPIDFDRLNIVSTIEHTFSGFLALALSFADDFKLVNKKHNPRKTDGQGINEQS